VTVACWEPGQISPNHCHPDATEIYFCFEGGGKMRTPKETVDIVPGASPGRTSRIHQRAEAHPAVPGALRHGHVEPAFRMARQCAVDAGSAGRRIFPSTPPWMSTSHASHPQHDPERTSGRL
jgi:mannose-6-phosphate isomerase-like protein (cupin superfamily)